MKRAALCCLAAASMVVGAGCRPARQEVRSDYRRADSLRALVAEELRVTMRDVVITPPDSGAPRIAAASVELSCQSASRVERIARETAAKEETSAPAPGRGGSLRGRLLAAGFILFAVAVLWRRRQ